MRKLTFFLLFILMASSVYGFRYTYQTGSHSVYESNNYELIGIENGEQNEQEFNIVMPYFTKEFEFDTGKSVKEIHVFRFLDPVEIIANLPTLEYDERDETTLFVDRDCFYDEKEAYVSGVPFYGRKTKVKIYFYPLEMTDCEENKFTLYQLLDTEIEFYEDNKIKSIEHTPISPGKEVTFTVNLENNLGGDIIVTNVDTNDILAEEVISGEDKIEVTFTAADFGDQAYRFEYLENDETVDVEVIGINKEWGDVDFRVLTSDDKLMFPMAVELNNLLEKDIKVKLTFKSLNDELEVESEMTEEVTTPPGTKIHIIDFQITEKETVNDLEVIAEYNGIIKNALHNSLVRFEESEVSGGLPPPPGEKVLQDIVEIVKNETSNTAATKPPKTKKTMSPGVSLIIGIILALVLTIAVIYILFKYMRTSKNE